MKLELSDFLTPFKDVTGRYDKHGKLISEKKRLRTAVKNQQADKADLKAEASQQIKAYAAVHQAKINLQIPNPSDIAFIPSGSAYTPSYMTPHDLLCFLAWSNGAAMEASIHAHIDEMTKNQKGITKTERQRQLRKLDDEIHELETERESMATELEKTGLQIARDPDLSPEVFLEYETPSKWNHAKLENLKSSISAERNRAQEVNEEIQLVATSQHELRSLVERSSTTGDRERFKHKLDDSEAKKKELLSRRDGIDNANTPRQKLYNRCLEFLKERGVEFEKPTVARIVSRAS